MEEHTDQGSPCVLQVLWHLCGHRMEANRKLVGERPGLTRVAVRAGGNHWLEDAQGLPFSCLAGSRAVSLGTFSGPLAGNEQCRRQAGTAVSAHLGIAWWLAGTEQWTAFGLGSASPAQRLRGRAVNANSLEAGSGGRQAWAHLPSLVPTTAQQTDGPGDPCSLARRVYTSMGI